MRRRLRQIRMDARREDGFTVFEMLVASLLLVIGMMVTFQAFDAASRNTLRLKQSQVVLDRAQQEMEKIRALPYSQIALTVAPGASTDANSPAYRINSGKFALTRSPLGNYADLVINGGSLFGSTSTITGGAIAPESGTVTSGDLKMRVYRYVVWQNDINCPNSAPEGQVSCPGNQDFKRVIVAVRLVNNNGSFSTRNYVEVKSDFIDPNKTTLTDPPPGPLGVVTAQQFWLSDTPCAATGTTTRADVTANHALHNTLGTCASGPQTGTTPGAPDALMTSSPPDTFLDDPNLPGFYDYANDFYLEPSPPDGDRGVQIRRQDVAGCAYSPAGTNPESKIHRWVTDPLPIAFTLTGTVSLEFYTAAINNATHAGKLCIYLFRRSEAGTPPVGTDTLMGPSSTVGSFTYTPAAGANWPKAAPTADDPLGWRKVRVQLTLPAAVTIPAGQRLGLALSTERAGTTFDAGLQILYDHHKTPTRIEVQTTTPINAG
jgi:Tfp pilus assembly protein PilV